MKSPGLSNGQTMTHVAIQMVFLLKDRQDRGCAFRSPKFQHLSSWPPLLPVIPKAQHTIGQPNGISVGRFDGRVPGTIIFRCIPNCSPSKRAPREIY